MKHPTLIYDAPYPYFGMRECTRAPKTPSVPNLRPRYTFPQIRQAVDRGMQAWIKWTAPPDDKQYNEMPRYLSAYMALLDGGHDTHVLEMRGPGGVPPWRPEREFPPIPTATWAEVREFMAKHEITEDDVRDAFNFDPMNRQYSVRTLGNDGVRWLMLRLMCDDAGVCLTVRARRANDPHRVVDAASAARPLKAINAAYVPAPITSWDVRADYMAQWAMEHAVTHARSLAAAHTGVLPPSYPTWGVRAKDVHARQVWLKDNYTDIHAASLEVATIAARVMRAKRAAPRPPGETT